MSFSAWGLFSDQSSEGFKLKLWGKKMILLFITISQNNPFILRL